MAVPALLVLLFLNGDPMETYAIVNVATGLVENTILWDGVSNWDAPEGLVAVPTEEAGIGWAYVDGVFVTPPLAPKPIPTPSETLAANTATRDALLVQATLAIAPLQDAVDLEVTTSAEIDQLKKWKQYRVAVNRIDLTQTSPPWPAHP